MSGPSSVIVLDPDTRAGRQLQLGFEREGIPTQAVGDLASENPGFVGGDIGLVIVGAGANGAGPDLVRRARELYAAVPLLVTALTDRRGDLHAAGADEVVVGRAFLRDIVTLGRILRDTTAEQRSRLSGSLVETTGVYTLVRALSSLGRSAVLTLTRGLRRGEIRFYKGEVTSAQVGLIHGQAAFHQLLLWTDAQFSFVHEDVVRRQQIPLSSDELFADAERFLDNVRECATLLSPSMILEPNAQRVQELGRYIPTEVHGVLRMFDGHRVLADILEDSPYRVFETLRVADKAVEAGLLREVSADRPKATWKAVLAIDEWLVGSDTRDSVVERTSKIDTTPRAPKPHVGGGAAKRRAKPSFDSANAPPPRPSSIDWGALVPRVIGAEVGPLSPVVPSVATAGEVELKSRDLGREKLEALMDTDKRERIFATDIGLEPNIIVSLTPEPGASSRASTPATADTPPAGVPIASAGSASSDFERDTAPQPRMTPLPLEAVAAGPLDVARAPLEEAQVAAHAPTDAEAAATAEARAAAEAEAEARLQAHARALAEANARTHAEAQAREQAAIQARAQSAEPARERPEADSGERSRDPARDIEARTEPTANEGGLDPAEAQRRAEAEAAERVEAHARALAEAKARELADAQAREQAAAHARALADADARRPTKSTSTATREPDAMAAAYEAAFRDDSGAVTREHVRLSPAEEAKAYAASVKAAAVEAKRKSSESIPTTGLSKGASGGTSSRPATASAPVQRDDDSATTSFIRPDIDSIRAMIAEPITVSESPGLNVQVADFMTVSSAADTANITATPRALIIESVPAASSPVAKSKTPSPAAIVKGGHATPVHPPTAIAAAPTRTDDEPSDGIIRMQTGESESDRARRLRQVRPPNPPEHSGPAIAETTGEIAAGAVASAAASGASTRTLDPRPSEPSILIADLAAVHTAAKDGPELQRDAVKSFSEDEEAFFNRAESHTFQHPKLESFDDLDDGYEPQPTFWERVFGKKKP